MPLTSLPAAPLTGVTDDQIIFNTAVKEAVENLLGSRSGGKYAAIVRAGILATTPSASLTALTARGVVNSLSTGEVVANGTDYVNLIRDVAALLQDMANLRASYAQLLQQLKG